MQHPLFGSIELALASPRCLINLQVLDVHHPGRPDLRDGLRRQQRGRKIVSGFFCHLASVACPDWDRMALTY